MMINLNSAAKRGSSVTPLSDKQCLNLATTQASADQRLAQWEQARFAQRMWSKDYTLWASAPEEISNRLGWLVMPRVMVEHLDEIEQFAVDVREEGFRHAVLLGMGGSSLAPDVFQATFGHAEDFPELKVLDSTHPAAVRAIEQSVELSRTLFIVSSKSGTTLEPLSFLRYFWARLAGNPKDVGRQFVAISDPGTPLERLARERSFRRAFSAAPDIGGRYSALAHFGLVPAALIGVSLRGLFQRAGEMADACAPTVMESQNPGLVLGAALGELALAGKNKVTFATSPSFAALPAWLEQLIAESTGKNGKGIVPVAGEPLGAPSVYGADRVFVSVRLASDADAGQQEQLTALEAAGHPAIRINVEQFLDLGAEFFRWEVAIAAAGAVLGIQPFNQPDVELAKELARKAMAGKSPSSSQAGLIRASEEARLRSAVANWLASARPDDYFSLQAYLAPTVETTGALTKLQRVLRDRTRLAATCGYGPRFLHSTGQLHKGGPNTGLFVQFVDEPAELLPVPETDYTFGGLIGAQAFGDYQALVQRGRRVIRVQLGRDVAGGLERFAEVVRG